MPTATATKPTSVIPGTPACPATAACPTCGNVVYNDGLRLINPYIGPGGRRCFAHVLITCNTCNQVSTMEFGG
jgi:hypothetical protein